LVDLIELGFYYEYMQGIDADGLPDEPITAVHQRLGNQAERLLAASGTPEMVEAADGLRRAALSMQRLLMHPLFMKASIQMDPSVPDPELRRAELADLAVDVVTASDYLLRLLSAPSAATPRLTLASAAGASHGPRYSDEDTFDRLTRQRLDARGAAVRLGMRLISAVHSDVASG
jgi:hypothetical protein